MAAPSHRIRWFNTLFEGNGTTVEGYFSVDAFNRAGALVESGADASPMLSVNATITYYFLSPTTLQRKEEKRREKLLDLERKTNRHSRFQNDIITITRSSANTIF